MHAWQATIDHNARVFTTHPQNPTPQSLDWSEDAGYWTGSASMPSWRAAPQRRGARVRTQHVSPTDDLLGPIFGF
ncbi:MAG: hypothetical protein R2789_00020 [Microthrixaceae bacterium]